jgi:hypothetical protein
MAQSDYPVSYWQQFISTAALIPLRGYLKSKTNINVNTARNEITVDYYEYK